MITIPNILVKMNKSEFTELLRLFQKARQQYPVNELDYLIFYGSLSFQAKLTRRIFNMRGPSSLNLSINLIELHAAKEILFRSVESSPLEKIICMRFFELVDKEENKLQNHMQSYWPVTNTDQFNYNGFTNN